MALEVNWSGGDDVFRRLATRLEKASAADVVTRAVGDAIEATAPQLEAAARGGAGRLPKRGGLAAVVAGTRINRKSRRARGLYVMRLTAGKNAVKNPGSINRGRVAHFTYGHGPLHFQSVQPGWFTDPMKANIPMVRARAAAAMRKAVRGV
jgi:hypothetical protein